MGDEGVGESGYGGGDEVGSGMEDDCKEEIRSSS